MRRFNTIIESANPPGINQLWIDKKKLRYFTEGKWHLLGDGGSNPPEISDHDTWIIDGEDTGKPTRGEEGSKGDNGLTPFIGTNKHWWIGTTDTGVVAEGTDGIDGDNGLTPQLRVTDDAVEYSYDGVKWIELIPKSDFVVNNEITNSPDEEDLTSVNDKLKLKNKVYSPAEFSGLGRTYLRKNITGNKNILTQDMINTGNTIYIIQYDYDLNGSSINIPDNCVLKFEGGSLSNGSINFNSTYIEDENIDNIFINVKGNGTVTNDTIYIKWFGEDLTNVSSIIQNNTTYIFDENAVYDISNQISAISEENADFCIFNVKDKVNIVFDCNNATFIYNHDKSAGYRNGGIFYTDSVNNVTIKNLICDGNYVSLDDGYDANNRIFICRNIGYSRNITITNFNIKHFAGAIYSGTWNPSTNSIYQGYIENLIVEGYSYDVRYVIAVEGCYNLIANIVSIYAHRPCYLGATDTAKINIICREATTTTFCLLTDSLFIDEDNNKRYIHCKNIDVNIRIDGVPSSAYNSYSRNGILVQQYENYIDRPVDYLIDNIKVRYYIPADSEIQETIRYIGLAFNDNIPNNTHNDVLKNFNITIICDNNSICFPVSVRLYHAQFIDLKVRNCKYNYNPSNVEANGGGVSFTAFNTITNPSNIIIEGHYGNVYCISSGGVPHDNSLKVTIKDSVIPNLFYNGINDTTKYKFINSDIKNTVFSGGTYAEYDTIVPNQIDDISKIDYLTTRDAGKSTYNKTVKKPFWWNGTEWITYPDSGGSTMATLTFTGAVEATYNGSTPVTVNIPTGGGGTTNYEDLSNKPKIGDVELVGTKTLVQLGIQPSGNYATETYVTEQITAAIGTINTALDNINGEVI